MDREGGAWGGDKKRGDVCAKVKKGKGEGRGKGGAGERGVAQKPLTVGASGS